MVRLGYYKFLFIVIDHMTIYLKKLNHFEKRAVACVGFSSGESLKINTYPVGTRLGMKNKAGVHLIVMVMVAFVNTFVYLLP